MTNNVNHNPAEPFLSRFAIRKAGEIFIAVSYRSVTIEDNTPHPVCAAIFGLSEACSGALRSDFPDEHGEYPDDDTPVDNLQLLLIPRPCNLPQSSMDSIRYYLSDPADNEADENASMAEISAIQAFTDPDLKCRCCIADIPAVAVSADDDGNAFLDDTGNKILWDYKALNSLAEKSSALLDDLHNGKMSLPKEIAEIEKVFCIRYGYIVVTDQTDDCNGTEIELSHIFLSRQAAMRYLRKECERVKKEYGGEIENGWEIEETDTSLQIYFKGCFLSNHICVYLKNIAIDESNCDD